MSIGPAGGVPASAAGAPYAQTKGSEAEKANQDATSQQRQVDSDQAAEKAAGIGQTEEDQETSERDADGRRLWEVDEEEEQQDQSAEEEADQQVRKSRDATGQSGNALDLSG